MMMIKNREKKKKIGIIKKMERKKRK